MRSGRSTAQPTLLQSLLFAFHTLFVAYSPFLLFEESSSGVLKVEGGLEAVGVLMFIVGSGIKGLFALEDLVFDGEGNS